METHSSPWCGRRVLVTGCTGFLGSAVTRELLDRGAVVVGLVRKRAGAAEFTHERFHAVPGRVEDSIRLHTAMAVHEVSAVFHFARTEPFGHDRGTEAVLRAAALYHPRVPVVTARPAGELRLAADEHHQASVPLGVARFGELFGGGDRKLFRVVPRTVTALLAGEAIPPADGPARDFVFVRDAARACLAMAEAIGAGGESLDSTVRSGWAFTERAITRVVEAVFAGRTPELTESEPVANPLGWAPGISLLVALGETIAWYREFHQKRTADPRRADSRKAA